MSDDQGKDALLLILGEIKGELSGIRAQIVDSNAATNRRIDDLSESVKQQTESLNRRIDDHQQDVDQRFGTMEKQLADSRRNTILTSGGVATAFSATAEIIKAVVN